MEGGDAEDVEEIEDIRKKLQTFAVEEYSNVARVSTAIADSNFQAEVHCGNAC
jgi:hypothetical protein